MAQYKQLNTNTWDSREFHRLGDYERYTLLYLKLNRHLSTAGCCKLPFSLMLLETGLREDILRSSLDRLETSGIIKYQGDWLAVKDANDGQPKGPKIKSAIDAALAAAPTWVGEWLQTSGTTGDERAKHPAIASVRHLIERYPPRDEWAAIIDVVGDEPDTERLAECFGEWSHRGYRPNNFAWIYEWYQRGTIPGRISNGKQSISQVAQEYAEAFNS